MSEIGGGDVQGITPPELGQGYSHADTAHTDVAHSDTPHSDTPHSDTAHSDTAHTDTAHSDTAHTDNAHYDGTQHSDSPHSDGTGHSDASHTDTAHGDVCVAENTKVLMADNSLKKIQDIRKGDIVKGFNSKTNEFVPVRVRYLAPKKGHVLIQLNGGVQCTPEHKVLIERDGIRDFVRAETLRVGDTMFGETGQFIRIDKIDRLVGDFKVYDLDEDNPRTYVAEGTVVEDATPTGHGDTPHSDTAHSDTAHSDTPHSHSTPHNDTPHGDTPHSDTAHVDNAHVDTPHSDTAHSDTAHSDTAHSDTAHSDVNTSLVIGVGS